MRLKMLTVLLAAGGLAVPALAQKANGATGTEASAKAEKVAPQIPPPPAGMGQVVFYRPSGMGGLVSCRVSEGDKVVNRLPPGKYFVQTTTPGVHEYSVHSESKDVLRVNVEDGETQYARCTIRMGIMVGRPNLSTQNREDFDKRGKNLKVQGPFDAKDDKEDKDKQAAATDTPAKG
jgi:hypothetical protein